MISSPPEEAETFRGKTLTPESPKPVHYPSPANIPILEKQMDPMFNEPAPNIGTPASFQYPQQTPSAHSTTSYYAEPQTTPGFPNGAAQGSVGVAPTGYSQPAAYGSGGGAGTGAQTQDTPSINSFSALQQTPASSYSDANAALVQDNRSAYPYALDSSPYAAQHNQAQSVQGAHYPPQANAGAAVDFLALLDTISPHTSNAASDRYAASQIPSQPSQSQGNTPASSLPAAPNLPPRPPAQDKPATHPNYNPNDDIRSYHPHSQKPQNAQHRGSTQLQPLDIRSQSFATAQTNQSPATPAYSQRPPGESRSGSPLDVDEDIRWPPEINKLYEGFLDEERRFVTEGQWDQFPMGSRLFIGNLPTEKVTKRDIFHRFFRHGKLAQISIKQAYGFVQFLDAKSCAAALAAEQGQAVRGRKMHLEISKPQRNTKKADAQSEARKAAARRRSRSPDYTRGGTGPTPRTDRYGGQNSMSPRERDYDRRFRDRDDYRPMRSPSPRGGRGRRDRSRDRYERRRSRSRSPRRYRSPSPRPSDGLPLPFRPPNEVPDVQVLVVTEGLPRDFIRWVEDTFRQAGLRINVLIMSARLPEQAVMNRQIVEGVLAIVKLNTSALAKGKVNVTLFDRRGGINNVQFNEYADLDPSTAAALVSNAKQNNSQPVQPPPPSYGNYSAPAYNTQPPVNTYPPTPTNPSNLSNLISSLDPNGLSQLLGAMSGNNSTAPTPQPPPAATGISPDLARLLSAVSSPQNTPYAAPAQPAQAFNPYQNSALASLIGGQPLPQQQTAPPVHTPTGPPPGQPDMNEIMAQLAKYQR